jgi:hypothetical protein
MYNLTSSGFGAAGDVYGGEVSYGMTEYPYTKKRNQEALVMTGGINFGDAAGVRTVVESLAVDIEAGEGKSVCIASLFSEGQHIYSTSVLS